MLEPFELFLLPPVSCGSSWVSFLVVLGLHCCVSVFSSCSEWGLLSGCSAQASNCGCFSWCGAQALDARASVVVATGLKSTGSTVVVHWLSCCGACGIPDRESNSCLLHWQVHSLPLRHQKNHLFLCIFFSFDFFSDLSVIGSTLFSLCVCVWFFFFYSSFAVSDIISHFSPCN